jgi:glycosyltransferase involved in cell wall biosynthesis
MGALKAFQQSFPKRGRSENISNKKVGIVFKTINPKNDNPEYRHFKKKCLADGRVTLLERTLDRGEVLGLMQACYAYISPHRAEGFGRTIKDALMLGKPTFATDFSGNTDFEGYVPIPWKKVRLKKGEYPFVTPEDRAWWAEPSDRVNLAAVFSPLS